jgi:hypothetical protein
LQLNSGTLPIQKQEKLWNMDVGMLHEIFIYKACVLQIDTPVHTFWLHAMHRKFVEVIMMDQDICTFLVYLVNVIGSYHYPRQLLRLFTNWIENAILPGFDRKMPHFHFW